MTCKVWSWLALLAVLSVAAVLVGCNDSNRDSGDEAEKQEIIDLMTTLATADGSTVTQEEIDFYAAHITDAFLQDFGTESIDACLEDAATCIGTPLTNVSIDPEKAEIDGDSATLVVAADAGTFGFTLIKDEDVWKANGLFVPDDEIAEGTEVVDLDLLEFAFEGDLESEAVKSGDFAFHVTNNGEQTHEVVLVALPEERTLEELLADESFEPEPIFVKFGYGPGDESDVALPAPLDPGRYGLVCFLPDEEDPEETAHAFKGMAIDFRVE